MFSDKIKRAAKIIGKHCFLPIMFFAFSFINIISCFINPINYGSLSEIVSNDIKRASSSDGLVEFVFDKKYEETNFAYVARYYFDQVAELNKKGKEYFIYWNDEVHLIDGEKSAKYTINYSIGITNSHSFSKLNYEVIDGEIKDEDYAIDGDTNCCAISLTLANQIIKYDSSINSTGQLLGMSIDYLDTIFTIDAIVDDTTFVNSKSETSNTSFITIRYGKLTSKSAVYTYHLLFNKNRYYDNYRVCNYLFGNIYRHYEDPYFWLSIPNNEWIKDDIDFYKYNNIVPLNGENTILIISLSVISLTLGILVGCIYVHYLKQAPKSKTRFYVFIASVFAYFVGLFFFNAIFGGVFIRFIHINVFTAYGALFSVAYFMMFFVGCIIPMPLFDDEEIKLTNEPLVSIIIPVYNGGNYLGESIKSALEQKYKNIEVIVVDDGSTDDGATEKVATSIVDERLSYYRKENGGVSSALNYGIERSNGKYIVWLSHDDLLHPSKLLYQLYFLENQKETNVIPFSKCLIINSDGKRKNVLSQLFAKNTKRTCDEVSDYFRFKSTIFNTLLIPREFFENNKFREDMRYQQDRFAYFQMLKAGYKFKYCDGALAYYRVHAEQGSFTRVTELDKDVELVKSEFIDYYKLSKDAKFINRYFIDAAKKSVGFKAYENVFDYMLHNRDEFNISKLNLIRSKIIRRSYGLLYKIKRKMFGR